MMETDRLMRDADPVADWRVDAESSQARAMLAGILAQPQSQPRSDTAQPSGLAVVRRPRAAVRRVRHRRLMLGGVAAAAVAVALAASTIWLDGPGGATPAYAVTANPDGSVELIVEWGRLDDPAGLAAELRQAGVPTELRSGLPERFCPGAAGSYTSEALNQLGPEGEPVSTDGYVMLPERFPENSVLVISTHSDTQTQFSYTMMYLAPAASTSCTLTGTLGSARYTGPSPHPTTMWWPQPGE